MTPHTMPKPYDYDQLNRNAVRRGLLLPMPMWTHIRSCLKNRSKSGHRSRDRGVLRGQGFREACWGSVSGAYYGERTMSESLRMGYEYVGPWKFAPMRNHGAEGNWSRSFSRSLGEDPPIDKTRPYRIYGVYYDPRAPYDPSAPWEFEDALFKAERLSKERAAHEAIEAMIASLD